MTTIQLLGRWSSKAVERYTQKAPLARAQLVPGQVLQEADSTRRTPDTPETPHKAGAILVEMKAVGPERPIEAADSPVVYVPAPDSQLAERAVEDERTVYIVHTRTKRVHRPDAAEGARRATNGRRPVTGAAVLRSSLAEPPLVQKMPQGGGRRCDSSSSQ